MLKSPSELDAYELYSAIKVSTSNIPCTSWSQLSSCIAQQQRKKGLKKAMWLGWSAEWKGSAFVMGKMCMLLSFAFFRLCYLATPAVIYFPLVNLLPGVNWLQWPPYLYQKYSCMSTFPSHDVCTNVHTSLCALLLLEVLSVLDTISHSEFATTDLIPNVHILPGIILERDAYLLASHVHLNSPDCIWMCFW